MLPSHQCVWGHFREALEHTVKTLDLREQSQTAFPRGPTSRSWVLSWAPFGNTAVGNGESSLMEGEEAARTRIPEWSSALLPEGTMTCRCSLKQRCRGALNTCSSGADCRATPQPTAASLCSPSQAMTCFPAVEATTTCRNCPKPSLS